MKTKLLFLGIMAAHLAFSQAPITVKLTRKVFPAYNYSPPFNTKPDKNDYSLLAGDIDDGAVKFTIAANMLGPNFWHIYTAAYGADTIIVRSNKWNFKIASLSGNSLIVIKAKGKEYTASMDTIEKAIILTKLEGKYSKPDITLSDSLMPDDTFKLMDGGIASYSSYLHQNKYVYVIFWNSWQSSDMPEIERLKNISNLYKNALTIISIHLDTTSVKEIEKTEKIDWVEARDGDIAIQNFPLSSRSGGVLYNSDGTIVASDIFSFNIKETIEKLLHVGN